ncbi:MAG: bacillithiol system redox-active protein YtxJ [Planctomycetota bacterium]
MTAPDLRLESNADLDLALDRSLNEGVLIFKHSTRCPISAAAHEEFMDFLSHRAAGKPFCALVLVVEQRPISLEIEKRVGVKHESPQALWVKNRAVAGSLSHGAITSEALAALAKY